MKSKIIRWLLVFTVSVVTLLMGSKKIYAKVDVEMDSRFADFNFYTCARSLVGEEGVMSDGYTLKDSALKALTYFSCEDRYLKSTKGIELMPNLKKIRISSDNISIRTKIKSINLQKHTKLEELYLNYNQLTSIDLSHNTRLKQLFLAGNKLNSINLSKNKELDYLVLTGNNLTDINLSNNTKLINLYLGSNQLTKINLKKNTLLRYLSIQHNKVTSIDLTNNNKLVGMDLNDNYMSAKPSRCVELGNKCIFGYVAKFDSNGGSQVYSQNSTSTIYKPTNPKKSGYVFSGWYLNGNQVTFPKSITSNVRLVAKWTPLSQEEETTSSPNKTTIIAIIIAVLVVACIFISSNKPKQTRKTTKRRTTKPTAARKTSTTRKTTGTKKKTTSSKKKK